MPEFQPHITFSPDGILRVRRPTPENIGDVPSHFRSLGDLEARKQQRDQSLNNLSKYPGITIEPEAGHDVVELDIGELLDPDRLTSIPPSQAILIELLNPLASIRSTGAPMAADEVLPFYGIQQPQVVVGEHFQGWLNGLGRDSIALWDCLTALAKPYGETADEFEVQDHGSATIARAGLYEVILRREGFGVSQYKQRKYLPDTVQAGHANWTDISLSTYQEGHIGVTDHARQTVVKNPRSRNLYQMTAEITGGQQALSLLLGLGSLSYHAAQQEAVEDVYHSIDWHRTRHGGAA